MKIIISAISFLVTVFINNSCITKANNHSSSSRYIIANSVDSIKYRDDSLYLRTIIKNMILKNKIPFQDKLQFDSLTEYFIDTVICSPDKLRSIIFVITKNSNGKLPHESVDLNAYYYNAYFFYGSRDSLQSAIKVYEYSDYSLVRDPSYDAVKHALQEYCFIEMALSGTKDDEMYNINDSRFWQSRHFNWVIQNSTFN